MSAELGAHVYSYDVSGERGVDDPDGEPSFAPGEVRPGRSGLAGGDAPQVHFVGGRRRAKGWDAGELRLNLSLKGKNVRVSGEGFGPEQTTAAVFEDSLPLESSMSIELRARGGAGGNGGRGGRGQDGDDGIDGSDASAYFPAGDGSNGHGGGPEGNSTNGGDAGAGGRITVTLPIEDLDLAMLIEEHDVRGNNGGRRGMGQGVGRGGQGGRGGAGAWWTEFELQTTRDADGNLHTESVTVLRSRPGGYSGLDGPDGERSSVVTRDGRSSRAGEYALKVRDESGQIRTYPDRFALKLLPGFKLVGKHNDAGFFEPGETIEVHNLKVINAGHCPTPKYQAIKIFLSDTQRWVVGGEGELQLPKVLEPGETFTFKREHLTFHLRERARSEKGVMISGDQIVPRSRVTRVEREFTDFGHGSGQEIVVRYPIQITPLESLVTLAPNEASRARFRIRNVSNQTIGRFRRQPELRVAYSVFQRQAGSVADEDLVVANPVNGSKVGAGGGIERAIEGLKPGEEILVETVIGLKAGAAPYTKAQIQPELFLESLLNKDQINRIQFEPFTLNVAARHEYHPGSDILLIANHGLDKKALDALKETAALKNLTMDIWDFSYYGFFEFSHEIADYESIFKAYRGKTILVLGNDVTTPLGAERVHHLLSPDRVIEAARRFGIKIAVLQPGAGVADTVENLTSPVPFRSVEPGPIDVREFASPADYRRFVQDVAHEIQRPEGDEFSYLGVTKITVHQTPLWPWSVPQEKNLKNAALKTSRMRTAFAPESKTFLDYEFEPRLVGQKFGLWRTWDVGRLYLRNSVDQSKTSVLGLEVPRLDDADFIRGEAFQTTFDFALNFSTKLNQLNEILLGHLSVGKGRLSHAETMLQTLLLDLVHEQNVIRPLRHLSRVPKANLRSKLDLLRELSEHSFSQFNLSPGSDEGRLFVRFIASLKFFNERATPWWHRYLTFGLSRNAQVGEVTTAMIDRLVRGVFGDVEAANTEINTELGHLRAQAKAAGIKRAGVEDFLDPKKLKATSVRDGDRQDKPEDRVRTPDQSSELERQERGRRIRAADVASAIHRQNNALRLNAYDCAQLLSNPEPNRPDQMEIENVDQTKPVLGKRSPSRAARASSWRRVR